MTRRRLLVVCTHPVQYQAPWFRHIAERRPELDLHVVYATTPSPSQQSVGFGGRFAWDTPLLEGYSCEVVRPSLDGDDVHSDRFLGLDVPEVSKAIRRRPSDLAMVFGWNSVTLVRALAHLKARGTPVLYRGDTHLGNAPSGWRRRLWQAKTAAVLRGAYDGWLSVGSRSREYLRSFGIREDRIFSSPHCVDNEYFRNAAEVWREPAKRAEARASYGVGKGEFVAAFVGKFEEVKRPLDLVAAGCRLGSGVRLLFIGGGPLEASLRDAAAQCGVPCTFAGFHNQSELGRAFAAADCLVLPSRRETWGLVVNEAMATGLPCIVSEGVGCAPDMIVAGETGETFPVGGVDLLASAVRRLADRANSGFDFAAACRRKAAEHSFEKATDGLAAACEALKRRRPWTRRPSRVVFCCGQMSITGGLERQTLEVAGAVVQAGGAAHCIVNTWAQPSTPGGPHPIEALARVHGATSSTGFYWYPFNLNERRPIKWLQVGWDILSTSGGLLRDAFRHRASHVVVPEFTVALRNAAAIPLLKLAGLRVVLRVGVAPLPGGFYRLLWGALLPRLVDRFAPNSKFCEGRLLEQRVPRRRIRCIHNAPTRAMRKPGADRAVADLVRSKRTVLCVGQLAPFKGIHILVEAAIELLREGADFQVVFVGRLPDWPAEYVRYVEDQKAKIRDAGFADRILFVGECSDVLSIMAGGYVLAAPIVQEECFGNVVLEAATAGLPAVVFPRGGLPELVRHLQTGYICSGLDAAALKQGLLHFLEDPEARARAAAESSWASAPDSAYTVEAFRAGWTSLLARF